MSKTVGGIFAKSTPRAYKGKIIPVKTTFDSLLVGLELEVENLHEGIIYYQDAGGGFWDVVEDGSLRPRGAAWEFVSKPAELGVALAQCQALIQRLSLDDTNYSDRCSVHVHTNVLDFTQEQLANLMMVYPVFENVLFQYVNHYKKQEEQGYCRDTNLYCIPWSACKMNKHFVDTVFNSPGDVRMWEKYTALNLAPIREHGTVEWRHMHGTADMEKLTTWLNLIGSIMKFCKENSFDDIVKTVKVMNDVSTYQQFFQAVLQDTLPYQEEYRRPMAEGIVNAKYSLLNWEAKKSGKKIVPEPEEVGLAQEVLVETTDPIVTGTVFRAPDRRPENRVRFTVPPARQWDDINWDTMINTANQQREENPVTTGPGEARRHEANRRLQEHLRMLGADGTTPAPRNPVTGRRPR